jgi:hypothetical protein
MQDDAQPMRATTTPTQLIRRASAWVPLVLSVLALGDLVLYLVFHGVVRGPHDEGAAARIWQLLMAGQVPIIGWFAVRWLPEGPRAGLVILGFQVAAALASALPVLLLESLAGR